jgi:hypothetical protein
VIEATIDSRHVSSTTDAALSHLGETLVSLGFDVEAGKTKTGKLQRPVLFGELGDESLAYEVDAFHAGDGVALEVEAGDGARGNAVYRDIIQTSLLVTRATSRWPSNSPTATRPEARRSRSRATETREIFSMRSMPAAAYSYRSTAFS